jgi:hypothetical protein
LAEHLNKILDDYGILEKVSTVVVDHASVMGSMCKELELEFYGCFAHFLNLVCKLFLDCVKKTNCDFTVSPEENENEETVDQLDLLEKVKNSLLFENELDLQDETLVTIEEETEEEIAQETLFFEMHDFSMLSQKINIVIKKVKKLVTTFNCSNNLTRDLLSKKTFH